MLYRNLCLFLGYLTFFNLKNLLQACLIGLLFLTGCSTTSDVNKPYYKPFSSPVPGQVFIPSGTFSLGSSAEPDVLEQFSQSKKISVAAFFIDQTEVSNDDYREFINWVRDSIAITNFLEKKDQYMVKKKPSDPAGTLEQINWRIVGNGRTIWGKASRKRNPRLDEMFYKQDHLFNKKGDLDTRILKYSFGIFDYEEAFRNRNNLAKTQSDYTYRDTINVYPDTTVWIKDFANLANDQMLKSYFSDPAFGKYPVVGITWKQAKAYTIWKTNMLNNKTRGLSTTRKTVTVRLPSEAEWEYASRGGEDGMNYPWGNALHGEKDCLMANFKVAPGNYVADGGLFTKPVRAYKANKYGVYNTAGNVAEWTENLYTSSPQGITGDLNPRLLGVNDNARRVVKGGSWRDAAYFIRSASRTFEHQDTARSYIGFRTVMSAPVEQSIKK
ncbi:MAG: gliding motility-associated lipoprotein [Chitinophagaceae bacterium]|nr:MAG: gliding motility-associated lipoprotein [Chitinophagaceae bacterium]